ncbi:MAG TPA: YlqD family protein [Armatimonadota bacterium]|nr:YlqD family protein [Armatimonadota bacterium]
MPSLIVRRPVGILRIVTEDFKSKLIADLKEAAESVEMRIQQIDFQTRGYIEQVQKSDIKRAMALKEQVAAEKRRHESLRGEILERLQEAEALELDSEYEQGHVESEIEIKEGDNITEVLGDAAIVVKDDVVIEIRGVK